MDRPIFPSRWRLCSARHRCVDSSSSNHRLGLMEVSRFITPLHRRLCVSVFRNSVLLRSPACVLQSSSSFTRSTSFTYWCEWVDRPERHFVRVTRLWWLASSFSPWDNFVSSFSTIDWQFWSHFGNPRSQLEGRNADYIMYVTRWTNHRKQSSRRTIWRILSFYDALQGLAWGTRSTDPFFLAD